MTSKGICRRAFMQRVAALTGGLAAVSVLSAGCAPKTTPAPAAAAPEGDTAPTAAPAKAQDKITLRVQVEGGQQGVQMAELCARWNEQNPNIEAVVEEVVYAEIAMKTEMGFATGDLQDSLFAFTRWHWIGAYKGWYLAIDDLLDAAVVPDYDDYYEIGVENQKFEGKTYGLIDSVHGGPAMVITWNRGLIEEAGQQPPTPDMDIWDLHELALKCTNADKGIFGIQMVAHTPGRLTNSVRAWGKPEYGANGDISSWLVSPDGKTYNFVDNPGAKAFFQDWLRPLLDAHAHPTSEDEVQEGLFVAGRVAMYQGHQGYPLRFMKSVGDTWDYHTQDAILLPVGPDGRRGTSWECHNRCVYAKTKYPEETLRLNAFVTSYDAGITSFEMTGNRSGRKSVVRDPRWNEQFPIYKALDELLTSGNVDPYPMPWNLRDVEASDVHENTMAPLIQGTATWDEQAPIVQAEMQKILDLERP